MKPSRKNQTKPAAPARSLRPLGRNGFAYRQQYGVIVLCDDEPAQRRTYEKLKRAGFTLRVVTV